MPNPPARNPWLATRTRTGREYDAPYEARAAAGLDVHGEASLVEKLLRSDLNRTGGAPPPPRPDAGHGPRPPATQLPPPPGGRTAGPPDGVTLAPARAHATPPRGPPRPTSTLQFG